MFIIFVLISRNIKIILFWNYKICISCLIKQIVITKFSIMEFKSEEEKVAEWHRRADEGKAEALRRERYFTFFVVLILVASILFVVVVLGAICYAAYSLFCALFLWLLLGRNCLSSFFSWYFYSFVYINFA